MAADHYVFPATHTQRQMWFAERITPNTSAFHLPFAVRLVGPADEAALTAGLRAAVRRHEALRTTFDEVDGEVVQLVAPSGTVDVPVHDLTGADEAALADRLSEDAARPFDLRNGPLVRFALLRLGPQERVLAVTAHHLVFDSWSAGVLLHELAGFYAADAAGREALAAGADLQLADYTIASHEALDGEAGERSLGYWQDRLHGLPPAPALPLDRPRPTVPSLTGGSVPVRLSPELSQAVTGTAGRYGVTPFVVLLASLQVLVGGYGNTEDVAISTAVADRPAGTEAVVGCLVNELLLRTSLADDPSVAELLRRVRTVMLGAMDHQAVRLDEAVARALPGRDPYRAPLTEVALVQNASLKVPALPGLTASRVDVARRAAQLPLSFQLWEEDGRFVGTVEFSADVLDAATVSGLLEDWLALLASVVADPTLPLSRLTRPAAVLGAHLPGEGERGTGGRPASEPPVGPVETTLAALWQALLGLDDVGRDQNFFESGGNSILAARMIAQIREVLQVEVELRTLFEAVTVADLAAEIRRQARETGTDVDLIAETAMRLLLMDEDEVRAELAAREANRA
ncbi:condensation domain-containing protein [Kitasatospora sp. NPDC085464]|uniref:condensation domain-containing protein n=1 Tax=Kitasatospora sp. NPDC085464 TaxID=3364063 RepID=UPI0037CBAF7F